MNSVKVTRRLMNDLHEFFLAGGTLKDTKSDLDGAGRLYADQRLHNTVVDQYARS
jgi:hypothetical protein